MGMLNSDIHPLWPHDRQEMTSSIRWVIPTQTDTTFSPLQLLTSKKPSD